MAKANSEVKTKALILEVMQEVAEQAHQKKLCKKRKVFQNTELLMKNYNVLKQHSEKAIYSFKRLSGEVSPEEIDMDEERLALMERLSFDDLYIEAILKSKIRTTIMVQHIDMALYLLQKNSKKRGYVEEQKYNALVDFYLKGQSYDNLAEKYSCATRTVDRWRKDMLNSLGLLLFGVDALLIELPN